jgi:hypothetical protein
MNDKSAVFPETPIDRIESGMQTIPLVGPRVKGKQCTGLLIIYWRAETASVTWDYGDIHKHHEASVLFAEILETSGWLDELMRRLQKAKFAFDFSERLHMPWQSLRACPSEIVCWCAATLPGLFRRSAAQFAEVYVDPQAEEEGKKALLAKQRAAKKRMITDQKTKVEIISPAPAEQRQKTHLRTMEAGSD